MEKEYISKDSNINIGEMSLFDKKDYLESLKEYCIEYRDSLGLNPNNTFGIEIEYEGIDYTNLTDDIVYYTGWQTVAEKGFEVGGELVSPIYKDDPVNWQDIKSVLTLIDDKEGTHAEGGAHVHVGAQSLKDYESLINLLLLYTSYEDVLYRFGYMDRLNPRKTMIHASAPLSIDLSCDIDEIMSKKNIKFIKNRYERFYGINFSNLSSLSRNKEKNTIEFRYANGTFDPVLWQNNVNTCTKLIEATHKELDIDKLLYMVYFIRESRMNYHRFDKLNIDKAIELCDIIFDNMLDKTNFLKQYIKDGRETVDSSEQTYTEKFTRS